MMVIMTVLVQCMMVIMTVLVRVLCTILRCCKELHLIMWNPPHVITLYRYNTFLASYAGVPSRGSGKKVDMTMDNKPVQNEAANQPPTAVADIPMIHMSAPNRGEHPTCMFSFRCTCVKQILYMSCIQDQVDKDQ